MTNPVSSKIEFIHALANLDQNKKVNEEPPMTKSAPIPIQPPTNETPFKKRTTHKRYSSGTYDHVKVDQVLGLMKKNVKNAVSEFKEE